MFRYLSKHFTIISILLISPAFYLVIANTNTKIPQTNLLMIMFDDLRPELSIYGRQHMITPNFERLASRSVVFDYAFSQVAVCNPSRDSLLTGLRPDTIGNYNFQHSYWGHMILPKALGRSGYNTAGVGKILHWDGANKDIWNYYQYDNDWYGYQGREDSYMNSSAMPDKTRREDQFRDHEFAEKAVHALKKLSSEPKFFMLGVGFKLPHLALHVPYKYFKMYDSKEKKNMWKLSKKELRFPSSVSEVSWRCCAGSLNFMREEGALPANRSIWLGDINVPFTNEMRDELMMGYCAGVSFVDKQVGKLLDALDQLDLWKNTTVVLTADHGMHCGEKAIWEKWTLFDEALRVPLLIAHPKSPFKGQHYRDPVELVDVFATVNDILGVTFDKNKVYNGDKYIPLQGKSLAPVVLGKELYGKYFPAKVGTVQYRTAARNGSSVVGEVMPMLQHNFAISQVTRCAQKDKIPKDSTPQLDMQAASVGTVAGASRRRPPRPNWLIWTDCDMNKKDDPAEISLMGYSLRTPDYKYIAYFHFNRTTWKVETEKLPYQQELYDHKNETLSDFTHREVSNLAFRSAYAVTVNNLRRKLIDFIKTKIVFKAH